MKTISVVVPTYNEQDNVIPLSKAIKEEFSMSLSEYNYEIIFIDNCSSDLTKINLEYLCSEDDRVKAIFNTRNFGPLNSPYYGLLQAQGDCAILFCADFQDPIYMITEFIKEWENGYKLVIGVKTSSRENKFMYMLRTCYYRTIKMLADIEFIEHFTGFGLYDRTVIETMESLNDPAPFLRGIVAELGYRYKAINYEQELRRTGKTHNNFYILYDNAMLSITSYTKIGLRLAVFSSAFIGFTSILVGLAYLIMKLFYWDKFLAGTSPMLIGMMFLGAVQLFFIGFIGEYILTINQRIMKRPLVIEEKRINF